MYRQKPRECDYYGGRGCEECKYTGEITRLISDETYAEILKIRGWGAHEMKDFEKLND